MSFLEILNPLQSLDHNQIYLEILKLAYSIEPVFYKLLYLSITAALMGCILLLIRKVFDKKISPQWKYVMWICLIIALIAPLRFTTNTNILDLSDLKKIQQGYSDYSYSETYKNYNSSVSQTGANSLKTQGILQELKMSYYKSLIFEIVIPLIWFFGLLIIGLLKLMGLLRLYIKIKKSQVKIDTTRYDIIIKKCQERLRTEREISIIDKRNHLSKNYYIRDRVIKNVRTVIQNYVSTPVLFGLIFPKILLPVNIDEISDSDLEFVFLHELAHLKRHDNITNFAIFVLRIVYWFNPFILYLFNLMKQDIEVANDFYVIKKISKIERKEYCLSILKFLKRNFKSKSVPKLLYMADSKINVERRIKMIKLYTYFEKNQIVMCFASILIIACISLLFLTSSSNLKVDSQTLAYRAFTLASESKPGFPTPPILNHLDYIGSSSETVAIKRIPDGNTGYSDLYSFYSKIQRTSRNNYRIKLSKVFGKDRYVVDGTSYIVTEDETSIPRVLNCTEKKYDYLYN